jgi:hypothetical protein
VSADAKAMRHHARSSHCPLLSLVATSLILTACTSALPPATPDPQASREDVPGFFSTAQAERGRQSYGESCSECHSLSDFRGTDFEWKWRRRTAWDFYQEMAQSMPEDKPGKLSTGTYTDIVAYVLSLNSYEIGSKDLTATEEAMAAIPLGAGVPKTKFEQ